MNFRVEYKKKEKTQNGPTQPTSIRGKRVVLTGTIPGMPRHRAVDRLTSLYGVTISPNVTKRTQVLIVANTNGARTTKIETAEKYGVPILKIKSFSDLN